jgi:hydrogenase expression/formation protein HypE
MGDFGERVKLAFGAGGKLQEEFIKFLTHSITHKKVGVDGIGVDEMDDGAVIPENIIVPGDLVVTADGHTVSPITFPGGNLGKLSVCGTVNDLLMMGAKPLALTNVVMVEEGFPISELKEQLESFNHWVNEASIAVIAGDTKVMPKGSLNGLIMATSGIGVRPQQRKISDLNVKSGDSIIISGYIGDHGATLLAKREGIALESDLKSDVALLTESVESILDLEIHAMKDITRGGLASALNEWALKSNVGITIEESAIPIRKETDSICKILGLDPMVLACEGCFIIAAPSSLEDTIVERLKKTTTGKHARIIGKTSDDKKGKVQMKTAIGGTRIIEYPLGEPIPRIC